MKICQKCDDENKRNLQFSIKCGNPLDQSHVSYNSEEVK